MSGHIRKRRRADGSVAWQVRITEGGREQLKTFGRKADAERWLLDRQAAKLRGDLISPEAQVVTVRELADDWRATWPGRLEPTSQRRYEQLLRLYVLPGLGRSRAATMTHAEVAGFLAGLPSSLSPSTVRKVHATLSALFTEGIRSGAVRVNPCRHQRLPRSVRQESVIVTAEEAESLALSAMKQVSGGESARVAVRLAFYTGLRAGELWALRRRDVDMLHGRVIVSRGLKLVGGRHEFGPTKTHAVRRVSLPASVKADVEALLAGRPADPEALLFTGAYGAPIRHNLFVLRVFRPAVLEALAPEKHSLRWHDLRHSHASDLLARGVQIHVVRERLGHASITMTVDTYGHLMPGADDDVALMLDAGVTVAGRSRDL